MIKRSASKFISAELQDLEKANINLANQVLDLEKALSECRARLSETQERCREFKEGAEATHKQFADLKERLHNSEMECSRLNGYMSRVREDDTVREDLITVGEPGVNERLVPKRKAEMPPMMMSTAMIDENYSQNGYGITRKPKHWVNY